MAFLEANNLHKTYRMSRQNVVNAVRGVDLSVEAGEMVAIMGPSGCGKSTLMHMLGLLHSPDKGTTPPPRLILNDMDMLGLSDGGRTQMRAQKMGFVFQDFSLLSNLTTLENISLQAEYAGWPRLVARDAGLESLGLVGLEGRISHRPLELSGGEQQRVAIARALVTKPSLLLADEPTGNLDTRNTEDVLDLLLRCNRDLGQTTVLVTHDIRVSKACNRLLMMQDGMIMDG